MRYTVTHHYPHPIPLLWSPPTQPPILFSMVLVPSPHPNPIPLFFSPLLASALNPSSSGSPCLFVRLLTRVQLKTVFIYAAHSLHFCHTRLSSSHHSSPLSVATHDPPLMFGSYSQFCLLTVMIFYRHFIFCPPHNWRPPGWQSIQMCGQERWVRSSPRWQLFYCYSWGSVFLQQHNCDTTRTSLRIKSLAICPFQSFSGLLTKKKSKHASLILCEWYQLVSDGFAWQRPIMWKVFPCHDIHE